MECPSAVTEIASSAVTLMIGLDLIGNSSISIYLYVAKGRVVLASL
jgi:hypothetical protein